MPRQPGAHIGPYEVQSILGAGGMGEVYLAHDARLGRDVAIKVLPEQFSQNPERLLRFEQEARSTGVLNHPNILAIYDVGSHEGSPYIVSELLEGETLRSALTRGPISRRKAIDYAAQIAKGLAAAHNKGLVHRDLKPENLFITNDGRVKILDFGLAKLTEIGDSQRSQLPTIASEPGMVLGTVGYMSPEQVRGQAVDARADLFAFGAILYEMLSGARAFHHDSSVETMNAILKEEPPDIATDRGSIPPGLDRIVRRCLEKPPELRFQSASDLGFALETLAGSTISSVTTTPALSSTPAQRSRRYSWKVVLAAAAIVLAFFFGSRWAAKENALDTEWRGERLVGSTFAGNPHVSPNGESLVFTGMINGLTQVAVMTPKSGNWSVQSFDRSRGGIIDLAWSNNGDRIFFDRLFERPQGIFSVPALGRGDESLVLPDAMWPRVLPDGSLVVTRINAEGAKQLHRFWPEDQRVEPLGALISPPVLYPGVAVVPGGREVVFFGKPLGSDVAEDHLYALDLNSGNVRQVAPAARRLGLNIFPVTITPDGKQVLFILPVGDDMRHIVAAPMDGSDTIQSIAGLTSLPLIMDFGLDGSLYLDQLELIMEILRYSPADSAPEHFALPQGYANLTPLPDGRLVVGARSAGRDRLMVMTPGGDAKPFPQTDEETTFPAAMLGKDRLAFLQGSGISRTVAIATLDGRPLKKLTGIRGSVETMAGSPDGKTLFYVTGGEVWKIPADDGEPKKVRAGVAVAVDPNGQYLVIQAIEKDTNRLIRVPLVDGGAEQAIPIKSDYRLAPDGTITAGSIAPDGRIAVRVASKERWWWPAAILDPRTGRLDVIPGDLDMWGPAWDTKGRVLTSANSTLSTLWRFHPVKR